MAILTFEPAVAPSMPLDDSRKPKVNVATFGDGYEARSPDGLNHDLEMIQLVWENLFEDEAKSIFDFLAARGGWEAFKYTVPWYETGNVEKLYRAPEYNRRKNDAGNFIVTASLKEVVEAVS